MPNICSNDSIINKVKGEILLLGNNLVKEYAHYWRRENMFIKSVESINETMWILQRTQNFLINDGMILIFQRFNGNAYVNLPYRRLLRHLIQHSTMEERGMCYILF